MTLEMSLDAKGLPDLSCQRLSRNGSGIASVKMSATAGHAQLKVPTIGDLIV